MLKRTHIAIMVAATLGWSLDGAAQGRTHAINLRPDRIEPVTVYHAQNTPLTLEITVPGITPTNGTFFVRNASNVVVITTNITVNGSASVVTTTAANWTTNTTGVLQPGASPVRLWGDLYLTGYGVPLSGVDLRVRYSAATGAD